VAVSSGAPGFVGSILHDVVESGNTRVRDLLKSEPGRELWRKLVG
jgi:hypothetical protein